MDSRLDRTVAYIATCMVVALVVTLSWIGTHERYKRETERIAIEKGYCQVRNGPDSSSYHWELCKPVNGTTAGTGEP